VKVISYRVIINWQNFILLGKLMTQDDTLKVSIFLYLFIRNQLLLKCHMDQSKQRSSHEQ
jgi:hypothetical protein